MYIQLYTINSNKIITRSRSMESLSMSCKFAVRISGSYGLILKKWWPSVPFLLNKHKQITFGHITMMGYGGPNSNQSSGPTEHRQLWPHNFFWDHGPALHLPQHEIKKKCHLKILASPNKRAQFYEPWVSLKSLSVDVHVLIYVNILYLCFLIIHIN